MNSGMKCLISRQDRSAIGVYASRFLIISILLAIHQHSVSNMKEVGT